MWTLSFPSSMSLLSAIKHFLPDSVIIKLHKIKLDFYQTCLYRWFSITPRVRKARRKEKINILFITVSPAIWKADALYNAMRCHKRFSVEILLCPNMSISDTNLREREYHNLRTFFDKKGYHYVEWCPPENNATLGSIPTTYDIIFYPQPYPGLVPNSFDFLKNMHALLVSCEYAFHSGNQEWAFNKYFQNAAWIDCYENQILCEYSRQVKKNKGVNSIATGLPLVDDFKQGTYASPWKKQTSPCKKIIWAPHWTITEECSSLPCYSNFLTMAEYMLEFAADQKGRMQFAFKPHPWLKRELYEHPDWGKERTDAYYSAWEQGENTQLEQGDYVDLFMTSDAMVHDCSSFCCEYLLTGKPVLFMARNEEKQTALLNEMSHAAFYSQYLGYSMNDLQNFLLEQVIQGHDPMKSQRTETVEKYLIPPHGRSAAENIIAAILGETA